MASALLLAILNRWCPDMTASACKVFYFYQSHGLSSPWGLDLTASASKFFFTFTKFMASALLLAVLNRWGPDMTVSETHT
jgi:hypothetical protein